MSHPEQQQWIQQQKKAYPNFFEEVAVLEVGSRNVNGGVRDFFDDPTIYVGIDCTAGPDVDVVCLAHAFKPPRNACKFDVVISCEAFEHDPYFEKTIPHILSFLRPGGLFIATWASPARQEHGTRRMKGDIYGPDPNFYKGRSPEDFIQAAGSMLTELQVVPARFGFDVYAVGFRSGVSSPSDAASPGS